MKKRNFWMIVALAVLAAALVSCPPGGDENQDNPDVNKPNELNPIPQTLPGTAKTVDGEGSQQVIHEVWMGVDTQADPRNAIGYKLKTSGKQFFDNVVVFHSGLSWDHFDPQRGGNRPAEPQTAWCTQTGIHHHMDAKIQYLLDNYDRYLKPIKDAGMRMLICPLPHGQGVTYGTIGSWPGGNDVWLEEMGYEYPAKDDFAREWAQALANFCAEYNFDGIALDEEYGDVPQGSGAGLRESVRTQNAAAGAKNLFTWLRYFKDYTTDTDHPNGKWVSAYWHQRYVLALPATLEVDDPRTSEVDMRPFGINDVVDAAYPSAYGSTMTSANGLTKEKIGYTAIAFDGAGPTVSISPNSIKGTISTMMRGKFGLVMYFALRERTFYSAKDYFGSMGSTPESYLTLIAEKLYQDSVIYDGRDYQKFPVVNGVAETSLGDYGSLYGHKPTFTPDY